nr:hypothetical protein [Tanacetum cinerariifolium]
MDMTIDQQVALNEALVPHASRLRIGKSNFCLRSDIASKESTLQVVYDVLRLTLFYKAFLVTADVPKIYMQEFWAAATIHRHSIRFKMNNKKRIVNLEYFREMLHIFINKCLSGKSTGYGSLRLSQAQILWGMYHKKNVDFAYLIWEDFVYQVEHKDAKKSNEMYYPRSSADEGTGIIPGVPDVPTYESDEEISWKSSDEDDDDDDDDDVDNQRGFAAMLAVLKPERLKVDKARNE